MHMDTSQCAHTVSFRFVQDVERHAAFIFLDLSLIVFLCMTQMTFLVDWLAVVSIPGRTILSVHDR